MDSEGQLVDYMSKCAHGMHMCKSGWLLKQIHLLTLLNGCVLVTLGGVPQPYQ